MSHAVWAGFQIVLIGLVQSGVVDRAQMSELISGGPPNAGFVIVMLAFMIGFFLGLLFVAGALWRSAAVPRWAAVCIFLVPFADFVPGGAIVSILGADSGSRWVRRRWPEAPLDAGRGVEPE
jgi:hypothetical protein